MGQVLQKTECRRRVRARIGRKVRPEKEGRAYAKPGTEDGERPGSSRCGDSRSLEDVVLSKSAPPVKSQFFKNIVLFQLVTIFQQFAFWRTFR
jgi:hypothetical protein